MAALMRTPSELASGMTSPRSLALALTPELEGLEAVPYAKNAVRALQFMANAYFARDGIKDALYDRLPGESQEDEYIRKISGTLMALGSITGAGAIAKDKLKATLENRFGLNQDLAGRVAEHMKKAHDVQQRINKENTSHTQMMADIKQAAENAHRDIGQQVEARINDIAKRKRATRELVEQNALNTAEHQSAIEERMSTGIHKDKATLAPQMLENLAHAVAKEQVRLGDKFDAVGKQIPQVLATANDVKDMIVEAVKSEGAQESEIPRRAFAALKTSDKPARASSVNPNVQEVIKGIIERDGEDAARKVAIQLGIPLRDFKSMLQVDDLHFNDLNRVRRHIMDAVNTTDDPEVQKGLREAYDEVSEIQDNAVERESPKLKQEYKQAKLEYLHFKRNIDGKIPGRLLAAVNMEQEIESRVMLANMKPGTNVEEVIAELAKAFGVNMSEWQRYTDEMTSLRTEHRIIAKGLSKEYGRRSKTVKDAREELERLKEETEQVERTGTLEHKISEAQHKSNLKETVMQHKRALGALNKELKEAESPEEGHKAVIPKTRYPDLAGKTNEQLRALRFEKLMEASERSGLSRSWRLALAMIGLIRMLAGEMSGAFEIAIGGGPEAIDKFMKSGPVRKWLAEEGGIEDRAKFDKAYKKVYPKMRKAIRSAAAQSALESSQKRLPEPPPIPLPLPMESLPTEQLAPVQ